MTRLIKVIAIGFLLSLLSMMLVSCKKDEGATAIEVTKEVKTEKKPRIKGDGMPSKGGTIVGAMNYIPSGMFNPIFYEEAYEANILDFTHEGLVEQNEQLEFVPKLAKDWNINETNTEVTFHLEEGVTWHDGEAFTAADVVFTYQTMADPDYTKSGGLHTSFLYPLLGYAEYFAGETGDFIAVVAEDDYTVTFKFAEPTINPLFYSSSPIIPKHIFENIPVSEMPLAVESRQAGAVIGTGPFKFTKMVEREEYILERNENYWQGTPYLDRIIWRVVAQSAMPGMFESGEIDFVASPSGIATPDIERIQALGNIQIIEQPDFGYQLLGFKLYHRTTADVKDSLLIPDHWLPNEKLTKPELRQAIAYAIDREKLIESLLAGHGQPTYSPIPVQSWAFDKSIEAIYKYDPTKAKKMLDELGYVDVDADGYREDTNGDTFTLNMHYPTGSRYREQSAPLIQQMLHEIGIRVKLHPPTEMAVYVEGLTNDDNDWDLYLLGWNVGATDPDPSSQWAIDSPYNFSRWYNPASDELLTKALQAPEAVDKDFRAKTYEKWQELFAQDLPAIPLYSVHHIWAYNQRLKGVDVLPFSMYHHAHLWWVVNPN